MSNPFSEVISNSTIWITSTAVQLNSSLGFHLQEIASGSNTSNVTGSVAAGTYTKTTFATAFGAALTAASPNGKTYTVTSDQTTYAQVPNTTPTQWGSSFSVSYNGTGSFLITIP